jgi:hypothetical protein
MDRRAKFANVSGSSSPSTMKINFGYTVKRQY